MKILIHDQYELMELQKSLDSHLQKIKSFSNTSVTSTTTTTNNNNNNNNNLTTSVTTVPIDTIHFSGNTLTETLYHLILLTLQYTPNNDIQYWEKEIIKLIKCYKISEKSVWYIKIQCYAHTESWQALVRLAVEKKSPIGYKPFARICIK
jgi:hypothetical protein